MFAASTSDSYPQFVVAAVESSSNTLLTDVIVSWICEESMEGKHWQAAIAEPACTVLKRRPHSPARRVRMRNRPCVPHGLCSCWLQQEDDNPAQRQKTYRRHLTACLSVMRMLLVVKLSKPDWRYGHGWRSTYGHGAKVMKHHRPCGHARVKGVSVFTVSSL